MHTTPLGYTTMNQHDFFQLVHFSFVHVVVYTTGLRTIWMPEVAQESHRRRHERVVFRKFEFGGEDAAFEWCAFWSLDQCLPHEHVIFGDGACGDAIWWVVGEMLVFRE